MTLDSAIPSPNPDTETSLLASDMAGAASLPWLVRFRWLALFVLVGALWFVQRTQSLAVDHLTSGALLLAMALSNVWLERSRRRLVATGAPVPTEGRASAKRTFETAEQLAFAVLLLDTALLTGVLLAAGGIENPFSIVYIAQIVLSALVLPARGTTWVTAASAGGFALLYGVRSEGTQAAHHAGHALGHQSFSAHLSGMWVAFLVVAFAVAYFTHQISHHLQQQREQIAALREQTLRTAHMASLVTLSAGAAHELRTPLSTILLALHELECQSSGRASAREDFELIREQVVRCQAILDGMGPEFEAQLGAAVLVDAGALASSLVAHWAPARRASITLQTPEAPAWVLVVSEQLRTALTRLINNAEQAGGDDCRVQLSVLQARDVVMLSVADDGPGMSATAMKRAREPFFTSKAPGDGMGLGLFLVHSFAVSAGGRLELESTPGRGLTAKLVLPCASSSPLSIQASGGLSFARTSEEESS